MDNKLSNMLDRAFISLETKDWKKANLLFEKALDCDPHSSDAYLGKSMADLHICDKKSIVPHGKKILKNTNFKLAVRFADESEKKNLQKLEEEIGIYIAHKRAKTKNLKKSIAKVSLIAIICFSIIFGCVIGYDKIITPMVLYNQAQDLLNDGKYTEAIEKYTKLKSYKDSPEKISEALYQQANRFLENNNYLKAFENLEKIITYKDSQNIYTKAMYDYAVQLYNSGDFAKCAEYFYKVKDYKDSISYLNKKEVYWRTKGNVVTLGKYEQDDNKSNGKEPIEWIVLDPKLSENTVLLISKLCLDYKKYDDRNYGLDNDGNYDSENDIGISWLNSSLRSWLNTSFFNSAFTHAEKDRLKPIDIIYSLDERDWITDNVSILTKGDAEHYFDEIVQMSTGETKYAYQVLTKTYYENSHRLEEYNEKYVRSYWLRSLDRKAMQNVVGSAANIGNSTIVEDKGEIIEELTMYLSPIVAVRPIIVISID